MNIKPLLLLGAYLALHTLPILHASNAPTKPDSKEKTASSKTPTKSAKSSTIKKKAANKSTVKETDKDVAKFETENIQEDTTLTKKQHNKKTTNSKKKTTQENKKNESTEPKKTQLATEEEKTSREKAQPIIVKDFLEEKKARTTEEKLNKKNEVQEQTELDEQWNNFSLEEKAEYLQTMLEQKEQLSEQEQKKLQKKMHEFLILLLSSKTYDIIEKLTKNRDIAQLSDLIIVFDRLISRLITKEYLNTLKDLQKTIACFKGSKSKKAICTTLCTSRKECIGKLLLDSASVFEPFINAGIGTTKIGHKQAKGMIPLFFSAVAPNNATTENILALSIMLDSSIQLLREAGRILEKSNT